jgi:ubiquinone/menaquinone biosynthesis C-methylase UbiE
MTSAPTARRLLAEAAALARIDELGGRMTTHGSATSETATARALWALGDYHRFAKATVWELGPALVAACGISPGHRVLDVATGTGNVALRAAAAGASVVASDLTPENFEAGRAEARALGVDLEWVEANAEALPFGDSEFDVVTSCLGAIFAPNHQEVADELVRVCRPGGVIGMINFTPEGLAGEFFGTYARHAPAPPPGSIPPLAWGTEAHVRELFGDRVASLELTRGNYVERSPGGPDAYVELFRETFGPIVALREALADDPERLTAFDEELREFARRSNVGAQHGTAEYRYEYLLVVARTPHEGGAP